MAGLFKLGPWLVSSTLIDPSGLKSKYILVIGSDFVTIKNETGQQLALNAARKITFAQDGLIYTTDKVSKTALDVHYVRTPAVEMGLCVFDNSKDKNDNVKLTLEALLGLNIENTNGDQITCSVDPVGSSITFSGTNGFTFSTDGTSFFIDGETVDGGDITHGDIHITGTPAQMMNMLGQNLTTVELSAPDTPYNASYNKYVIDFNNFENTTITEEQVNYESKMYFDKFGQGYNKVENSPVYISNICSYVEENGEPDYRNVNDYIYIDVVGNTIKEFNLAKLSAALDTNDYYLYDFVKSSEKLYIGYARPMSSYVRIYYYYSKKSNSDDECSRIEDTPTRKRAIIVNVYKDKIVGQSPDPDISYIEVRDDLTPEEIADAYNKLQKGVGIFYSPYKLYYYRDYGDKVRAIFNRENSTKYWELYIYDQTTRWKTTLTERNGSRRKTLATKYLPRYKYQTIWGIYPAANPYVLLNMKIKRSFDEVADSSETMFINDALDMDAKTIKLFSNVMYINILNVAVSFPRIRLSYSTLALMKIDDKNVEILFQGSSGAIYGRYKDGNNYTYVEKDDLLDMMNSVDPKYEFKLTCNKSKMTYKNAEGGSEVINFANSTIIAAENLGDLYRIYYKNSNTNGFVIASSYEIQE